MDLDLRKLRYFAAVAEHRHFGRAAAELYVAQPVLSRQVRALERELGCDLLVRTTRSVRLTAAGEQLYEEARVLLAEVGASLRRVHDRSRDDRRLVVGFVPGLRVADAVRAFAEVRPDVVVDLLQLRWWEQDAPLRDGRAHLAHLRRPFDGTGLDVRVVGQEAKVVCMPAGHPLAGRESLVTADLDGHAVLDAHARRTSTVAEKLELVASGLGLALVPSSVAETSPHPALVTRALTDAEPVDVCLAVRSDERLAPVRELLDVAERVLASRLVGS